MAVEQRWKMNREERAKQFMPFAALKGYEEALHSREKIVVPKMELSEEYAQGLDRKFQQVKKKDIITVVYYSNKEYLKVTGMVSAIDETSRILRIVNCKIKFDDIYDIDFGANTQR
ncbi:MAG: YolD-like family protein [Hespellia sp.]|nr:YolD-like family protein [Hespellia sp.]